MSIGLARCYQGAIRDLRDMAKATLPEAQFPAGAKPAPIGKHLKPMSLGIARGYPDGL